MSLNRYRALSSGFGWVLTDWQPYYFTAHPLCSDIFTVSHIQHNNVPPWAVIYLFGLPVIISPQTFDTQMHTHRYTHTHTHDVLTHYSGICWCFWKQFLRRCTIESVFPCFLHYLISSTLHNWFLISCLRAHQCINVMEMDIYNVTS